MTRQDRADRTQRKWRRAVVAAVVVVQLGLVVRAYWSDHDEFGFQMFPEASTWQADIVRVTTDGRRVPITVDWFGYRWNDLADVRGLGSPWRRHHADTGIDNQLAYLDAALDWVALNTPADTETAYLEAQITYWYNEGDPVTITERSVTRELDP